MFDHTADTRGYRVNIRYLIIHILVFTFNAKPYWRSELHRGTPFAENISCKSIFIFLNMAFWKNNLESKFLGGYLGS